MFRFFLQPLDDTLYYVTGVGSPVTTTAVPTAIEFAPDGWAETEITWNRDLEFWGIFRSFSNKYKFVEDGAKILRQIYVTQGVEGFCRLVIEKQNDNTTAWEDYYSGEMDFEQFLDDGFHVSINIMEGGAKAKFDSLKDTPYEILIDPADALTITNDGIRLQAAYRYIPIVEATTMGGDTTARRSPLGFYLREGDYEVGFTHDQEADFIDLSGAGVSGGVYVNYLYEALIDQDTQVYVKQAIEVSNPIGSPNTVTSIKVMMAVIDQSQTFTIKETYTHIIPGGLPANSTVDLVIDHTFNQNAINKGDRIYVAYFTDPGTPVDVVFFGNPDQTVGGVGVAYETVVYAEFRLPATTTLAYRYVTVYEKLIDLLSEGDYTGASAHLSSTSNILDSRPYHTALTSGDALRGFADSKILTTLTDLFKDATGWLMMAMGIENNVFVLEDLRYFLDDSTEIADLGEVSNLTYEPSHEYFFNKLKIGQFKQDYDGLNGRDEFNTEHNYKLPITKNKEENLLCTYRFDCYGIEQVRVNLSGKTTTDSKDDNQTFGMEIESTTNIDGTYHLYRPTGTITGILFPETKYNFGRSPKRNFYRNGGLLHFVCDLLDAKEITFQTSDKNQDLVSQFGANPTITESANVVVSTLADAIAKPVIFRFEGLPPVNIMALMASNPRGYFSFTWNDTVYKGFPMSVGTKPATSDKFNFILLATADTDLTNMVQ